jgi:beta-N-acetylhexosaminidase
MTNRDASPSPDPLGQILFVGIVGTVLDAATRSLLTRVRPGGIIIFKRNVSSLADLAALCASLRTSIDPPPLLAIDEEGGRVTRLAPHVTGLPAASLTAANGDDRLREYWRRYGDLLRSIGLDIDFAPVVDLCPADAPNGIADRSYGTDPEKVIACASAAIEGLLSAGILPTLKHFPGLGDTLLDSHHHLPSVVKKRDAFEKEDLVPFIRLAKKVPAVMVGHGHYPFYAGPDPIAATLVKEITTTLLRERAGFAGAAISDDLEMKAVALRVAWDDLAPRAVAAGNDMLLICHSAERIVAAHDALRRRADRDAAFALRCQEAAGRVAALRLEIGRAAAGSPGRSRPAAAEAIETARAALVESAALTVARA